MATSQQQRQQQPARNPLLDPDHTPTLGSRVGLLARDGDVNVPVMATGTCVLDDPLPSLSLTLPTHDELTPGARRSTVVPAGRGETPGSGTTSRRVRRRRGLLLLLLRGVSPRGGHPADVPRRPALPALARP